MQCRKHFRAEHLGLWYDISHFPGTRVQRTQRQAAAQAPVYSRAPTQHSKPAAAAAFLYLSNLSPSGVIVNNTTVRLRAGSF